MAVAYSRQGEHVRRSAFIDATIECLAEHGYYATSVRKIAEKAGVAPGLLTHYYSGKEELIADAYRHLADITFNHAADAAAHAGDDPRSRLRAFVTACFYGPALPIDIFKVWINFWALTLSEPLVRVAHGEGYGRYRRELSALIADVLSAHGRTASQGEVDALAIGANAVIDGLWLEYGLDSETFDAAQAARIACRFVGSSLGVNLEAGLK